LFVDPDEETGASGRFCFLSNLLVVGEDKVAVLFYQRDGRELRNFIRGGVHDGDDESFVKSSGACELFMVKAEPNMLSKVSWSMILREVGLETSVVAK
jgi:hypothetical protein